MIETPLLTPGTLLAGKFRIERQLGAGAMGAVYAIQHELTRHRRALKLLHADVQMVPDMVRRFLNEASAAGRAGNPHLVETFDAGTLPSGEPYVVMELLEGETLASVLEREAPLAWAEAAELVAQTAEGVEAAHAAGIVHRDLKPENLFVTQQSGQPFVKILDFGVSKFATASAAGITQTRAGAIYGSPAYMSPEQLLGSSDVDARSDVFALGIVLYQCLTGRLPFEAQTLEGLAARVLTGEPTPIESLRADLPQALLAVLRQALAIRREDRFETARGLAEALGPFRVGTSRPSAAAPSALAFADTARSEAPPPPLLARQKPPRTRRRAVVGAVTVSALAAFAWAALEHAAPRPAPPAAPSAAAPVAATTSLGVPTARATPEPVESAPTARTSPTPTARAPLADLHGRPFVAPVVSSAPRASASAQPSNAESLGLRGDNPFR